MATKKKTRKQARPEPKKTAENGGRDPATGRFVDGNPGGPGRPRGYDFRKIVEDRCIAAGETVEAVIGELFDDLRKIAKGGDGPAVAAAREVIGRLCESDATKLQVEHSGEIPGPPVPSDTELAVGIAKLAELGRELLQHDGGDGDEG